MGGVTLDPTRVILGATFRLDFFPEAGRSFSRPGVQGVSWHTDASIASVPEFIGVKQNRVPGALQTTYSLDLAGYAVKLAGLMA